jgi:hypothetical protein
VPCIDDEPTCRLWPRRAPISDVAPVCAAACTAACAPPFAPAAAPRQLPATWLVSLAAVLALVGCAGRPAPPAAPLAVPGADPGASPAAAAIAPLPWVAARTWDEYRLRVARRIVAANPDGVYHGPVPDPLLAIPVLEVELEGDGRVRQIRVLRVPTQARDTTQTAIDAVRRAAPFEPVAHLPRPWKFAEVFLFDDTRRFKPRTLDTD